MREAFITRKTNETDIKLKINIDGKGKNTINTEIYFFNHMLEQISRHGSIDMQLDVNGDYEVDDHHVIEDSGIVFGKCIKKALGDKKSIKRYGSIILPMDEALVLCAIDLSGRPYLNYNVQFTQPYLGSMSTEMVEQFFRAIVYQCGMNLHIKLLDGSNNHHIAEAVFKSFAKVLKQACEIDKNIEGVLSTKGSLEE